jgi:protein-S-isoprenylcysteine O-methyltransferase Ste14
MIYREWVLTHFPLFRFGLFLCSFGYWIVGYYWFKPKGREFPQAVMAVWTQLSVGMLLDYGIVRLGYWAYRPMPFTLRGIPIDLHLDWGLVWGFFLTWLYSKLRRFQRGPRFVILYLIAWTLLTVAFDAVVSSRMLFLAGADARWWLADTVFLLLVQGITLAVYHTGLFPSPRPFWRRWSCCARSVLYVVSIAAVFYVLLPQVVLKLTHNEHIRPLLDLRNPLLLVAFLALPCALGTWAILAFAYPGFGTPLPLDPPRRLVCTGPYAYVRNPMMIAGLLLALLLPIQYPTPYMVFYLLDMGLVSLVLFALFERDELEDRFGEEYIRYRKAVRNWIPRLVPYRLPPPGE